MKARIESGKVVKYRQIPTILKHKGTTILKADTLSPSKLEELGFYDVITPTHDSVVHSLSNLHFSETIEHTDTITNESINIVGFTYDVSIKELPELSELKLTKIDELNKLAGKMLSETDFYVIRKMDGSGNIPATIKAERLVIRASIERNESAINALTGKREVIMYSITM